MQIKRKINYEKNRKLDPISDLVDSAISLPIVRFKFSSVKITSILKKLRIIQEKYYFCQIILQIAYMENRMDKIAETPTPVVQISLLVQNSSISLSKYSIYPYILLFSNISYFFPQANI